MDSVNAPATATKSNFQCPFCLEDDLEARFNDFVVTHCCKQPFHFDCMEKWKANELSIQGREACTVPVKPCQTYLSCMHCRQNALPVVNLNTLAYSNSHSTGYCLPDLADFLKKRTNSRQASSSENDQGGAEGSNNSTTTMASGSTSLPASSVNDARIRGSEDHIIPDLPTLVSQGLKRRHEDLRSGIEELLAVQACVIGDQDMLQEIAQQAPDTFSTTQETVLYQGPVPLALVAAEHNHETCVKKMAVNPNMFRQSLTHALEDNDEGTLAMLIRSDKLGFADLHLLRAIERKDKKKAKSLLAAGVDPYPIAQNVIRADHSPAMINFLLSLGLSGGKIVLMAAKAGNRVLLCDFKASSELRNIIRDGHFIEAIILAAQQEHRGALRELTAFVTLADALLICVREHNEPAIAALLKSGACLLDAMVLAVSKSQLELFEQLLARNIDDGGHYLRLAAQSGDEGLVQALLNAGIDANGGDGPADTPLVIATRNSHARVVSMLHDALGPDQRVNIIVRSTREGTETELRSLLASYPGAGQMFREMQRVISYLRNQPGYGEPAIRRLLDKMDVGKTVTILSEALKNNDDKMLATLLTVGVDPNITDCNGLPLLHAAADRGDLQMVQLLLERGAIADLLNMEGKTAFSIAVRKGYKSIANQLIKATGGVDIESEVTAAVGRADVEMLRPLLGIADLGGTKFRQLFRQAAVSEQRQVVSVFATQTTFSVEIAFAMALGDNELQVVDEFLKAGMDKSRCWSASGLLIAAARKEEEKVKMLMNNGIDPANDIKLAAQARETEALSVLLSSFDNIEERNSQVKALIFSEVDNPPVFSSLVDVERESGAAGLRTILVSILAMSKQVRTDLESVLTAKQIILAEDRDANRDANRKGKPEDSPALNRQGGRQRDIVEEPPGHGNVRIKSCDDAINDHQTHLERNEAVIRALIRAGADLDITDETRGSLLSQAIQENCHDSVRSILAFLTRSGPTANTPAASSQHSGGYINRDLSRVLTDALVLAIGLDRQPMVKLLLDAVHGMKHVQWDLSRLNGTSDLLLGVAQTGNIDLLRELWQLGVRATPSLIRIVQRVDENKLHQFVRAGIKLNAADVGRGLHPLLLAAIMFAENSFTRVVRSIVSITDNVDDVICDQQLTLQESVRSKLWQIVAEQHDRIMSVLVRAADGGNHRLFETLAGNQEMADPLGRCLSDAARRGHRKVVSELINIDVDINSEPEVFLYDVALEHPDIAKMVVNYWAGKANRNLPVIVESALTLATEKLTEQPSADRQQTEQLCLFLKGLLGNTVPSQSTDYQKPSGVKRH
ncbi:ankyrin repeat domain-containing protein [Endozoicomonas sp. ALB091]|uniref:ankyrin repeat domain-containing protein n=1 Tax=Endozoicomonas sp. ALB091 TaxID=3403073 RepID=UPI003BB4EB38